MKKKTGNHCKFFCLLYKNFTSKQRISPFLDNPPFSPTPPFLEKIFHPHPNCQIRGIRFPLCKVEVRTMIVFGCKYRLLSRNSFFFEYGNLEISKKTRSSMHIIWENRDLANIKWIYYQISLSSFDSNVIGDIIELSYVIVKSCYISLYIHVLKIQCNYDRTCSRALLSAFIASNLTPWVF